MSENRNGTQMRRGRAKAISLVALSLALASLPGCKKDATPETVVTVQAVHPEQGTISRADRCRRGSGADCAGRDRTRISAPVRKFYVSADRR